MKSWQKIFARIIVSLILSVLWMLVFYRFYDASQALGVIRTIVFFPGCISIALAEEYAQGKSDSGWVALGFVMVVGPVLFYATTYLILTFLEKRTTNSKDYVQPLAILILLVAAYFLAWKIDLIFRILNAINSLT